MRKVLASFAGLCAALLTAHLCWAQLTISNVGGGFGAGAAAYVGPGDLSLGSATLFGSCQWSISNAYASVATNKLCNLRRTLDSHTCDILVNSNGKMGLTGNCSTGAENGSVISTWCTAGTSCVVVTLYDQSGGGQHWTQATGANQPQLTFSAINGLAALHADGVSNFNMDNALAGAVSQPYTLAIVGTHLDTSLAFWAITNSTNVVWGFNSSGTVSSVLCNNQSDSTFTMDTNPHVFQYVCNGASGFSTVDTTQTALNTGTQTLVSTESVHILASTTGSRQLNGYVGEIGMWSYSSGANQTTMYNNARTTRWGF
jgi:hypothetical protein